MDSKDYWYAVRLTVCIMYWYWTITFGYINMDNGYRNGVSDLNTKRHIDILLEFSGKTVIENGVINSLRI